VGSFLCVVGREDRCHELVLLAEGVLVAVCVRSLTARLTAAMDSGALRAMRWASSTALVSASPAVPVADQVLDRGAGQMTAASVDSGANSSSGVHSRCESPCSWW
jgi:hypothetical protein